MTTASAAYSVIKTRLQANAPAGLPIYWQNDREITLPLDPASFAYVEFLADRALLASFGSGRGGNRYRHPARIDAYVFVPQGDGLTVALTYAEQIATVFRSFRDSDISCFEASVYPGGSGADLKPAGLTSEVGNYFWALAEISLFYDLIG